MVAASIRKHIEHTKGGETKRNTEQKKRLQNVGRVRARTRKEVRASEQNNNYAVLAFLVCPAGTQDRGVSKHTFRRAVRQSQREQQRDRTWISGVSRQVIIFGFRFGLIHERHRAQGTRDTRKEKGERQRRPPASLWQ